MWGLKLSLSGGMELGMHKTPDMNPSALKEEKK